jgi:uncharacterized protein
VGNVKAVQGLYEAFGRGDIAAVVGGMDPDIHWSEAEGNPYRASGGAFVGPDAIVQGLFIKLGGDFDGFTVSPKDFYDAGDSVIVEGRYTGTNKATGKALDAQFCHIFSMMDGKLHTFQQFVDTAQMQDVLGAR